MRLHPVRDRHSRHGYKRERGWRRFSQRDEQRAPVDVIVLTSNERAAAFTNIVTMEMISWLVACVACVFYATPATPLPAERLLLRERRIVAGAPAALQNWPHIAYLHFLQPKPKFKVCSAVIVDRQWALTTAHCVLDIKDKPHYLSVGVGRSRRSEVYNSMLNKTVSHIIVYPKYPHLVAKVANAYRAGTYKQLSGQFDYDIALLRFTTPLTIGNGIKPIAIAKPLTNLSSIGQCQIAGWGAIKGFSDLSELLLQNYTPPLDLNSFSLPIVTNQVCQASYKKSKLSFISDKDITSRIICAGDVPSGTGSGCLGDSGSPLVCNDRSNRKVLCGLLVTGNPSCKPGVQYMVLTRVSTYANWIYGVIHSKSSGSS